MFAVYKKELRTYFTSPVGYIFIAGLLAVSGFLFSLYTVQNAVGGNDADVAGYNSLMIYVLTVFLPILTMKSFSEEKKLRTEQLLLTSPVRISSLVIAKFLAAFTLFFCVYAVSCFDYIILDLYGNADQALVVTNAFTTMVSYGCAMLLIGAAFIAIGVFISSLTENQIVACVGTVAILLLLSVTGLLVEYVGFTPLRELLRFLSVYSRFINFTYGVFDYGALVYYLSVAALFLFLTVRVYERRRYA